MKYPVFMYHALVLDGLELLEADPHYSITLEEFSEHINICIANGFKITSLLDFHFRSEYKSKQSLCFYTFDDGHCSNYIAAKLLKKQNFTGDFFINTSKIDEENYLTSSQLREMHEMGMSIQTHGHEHKYFSDLSEEEIVNQFVKSKNKLGEILGDEVLIFAPPGGRINRKVIKIATNNGITIVSNSRPGLFSKKGNMLDIPRIPILHNTSKIVFLNLLLNKKRLILKLQLKYYMTKIIKLIMGNRVYEKFRLLMLK